MLSIITEVMVKLESTQERGSQSDAMVNWKMEDKDQVTPKKGAWVKIKVEVVVKLQVVIVVKNTAIYIVEIKIKATQPSQK